ncbi:Phosducin-like protein 2 [Physocladia obscura]|uniref:Phosducin-like protein 2 n=1 Tax=Physocladia obscura TaxID=109957 RepID=A0AAD5T2D0_9FUNG|nr:Phosducin-like protein 2 [Physocladia obscura]
MNLNREDERIIRAIEGYVSDECDDIRSEDNENNTNEGDTTQKNTFAEYTPELQRIIQDQQLRQDLGVGGAMTGTKGVINDHKFHLKQERARKKIGETERMEKISKKALKSGWLQRQLVNEKNASFESTEEADEDIDDMIRSIEDEEDSFVKNYKLTKLAEMSLIMSKQKFGIFKEIDVEEFVSCVEDNDSDVAVIVHLYQPEIESCRLVNEYLQELAPQFKHIKMVKILSTKADATFDVVALPALLIYKGGNLEKSLLRITDDIQGWARTGRCSLEDFEDYLCRNHVL